MVATAVKDCFLPNTWYPDYYQAELLAAGIKVPVYKQSLETVLGYKDNVPLPGKSDKVYVPHFGDQSIDHVYDAAEGRGNPLANEDRSKMCILITPPIQGLDYYKFCHGVPIMGKDVCDDAVIEDDIVSVVDGYLPDNFRYNALHVQDISINALHNALDGKYRFEVLGAKLSPLSSGKANIAMFVKFETECPFDQQMYLPINDVSSMKIRVIPNPIITENSQMKMKCLDIIINVVNLDEGLFDHVYRFANSIMTHDLKLQLRHIRTDKGQSSLIIAGHALHDILISPYMQKLLARKITLGLMPYIVKNVEFHIQ